MRSSAVWLIVAGLAAGCNAPRDGRDTRGLLGRGLLDPFPSIHLMDADGHVDIPEDLLPDGDTLAPVHEIRWRRGFSPVQTIVVNLDDVDRAALPSWRDPAPGSGGVLLVDLDTGRRWPVMAELDAHPDAAEAPSLLIRPQQALPDGHTVAVVVTTDVTERPLRFERLLSRRPPEDFAHNRRHYVDLLGRLDELGIPEDTIALAWDFPVDSGTTPLRSALEQAVLPTSWRFSRVRNADDGDAVGTWTWRSADGTLDVTDFLVDDARLDSTSDGDVTPTGTTEVPIHVHIPPSVADAEPGSVPILLYGHGINGHEADALDLDPGYVSAPLWLAEHAGFIVVSTAWRGLDARDSGPGIVAHDFWRLPELSDRMVQGQVNTRSLVDALVHGDLASDPVFAGTHGESLVDPDRVVFWGNSMGAILGGVFMAHDPPVQAGVLHAFGAAWTTLLERSSMWRFLEGNFEAQVSDPADRQVLYAAAQLWWDPVDPAAYAPELTAAPLLLQENQGDDSVSNLGARLLVRSIDIPLLEPAVAPVVGVPSVPADLPAGSRAYVQLDPRLGEPDDANRPATVTGAHNATSYWEGTRAQMRDFLDPDRPGAVVHHCGDRPCTRFNQGSID